MPPYSALISDGRFIPSAIAARMYCFVRSGFLLLLTFASGLTSRSQCSWVKLGTALYLRFFWCTRVDNARSGDGVIASTSPPRMAWISELVSVMILKEIVLRPAFLPYHFGFFFRVMPWPAV